jgi:acyl phosphate:glycerol-3-phosphate acyltransferase
MASVAAWTILGFAVGSVPFAYLVVRFVGHEDIRAFGSHNPGGMNVARTVGWPAGIAVIVLDFLKGLVPVGLAHHYFGVSGWYLVPIALAPILGHAYTPWLGFRGGKAVAVSFGVWGGLLGWPGVLLLALAQGTFLAVWKADSWVSAAGIVLFIVFLWVLGTETQNFLIAVLNGIVVTQRYWPEFKDGLRPRYAGENT